jgi:putative PEP-CTERM system TPR-repeat lipoprotein
LAEPFLQKAVDRAPGHVVAHRLLAASRLGLGRPDRALDALQPLLADAAGDPAALALAAEAHLAKNDLATAANYLERATKADASNPAARTRLAQVRLATGNVDRAVMDLEAVSQSSPEYYQADLVLALNHLRRNEPGKALSAIASLETKQPDNPLTHNLKGAAYLAQRDTALARTSFEEALKRRPTYLPALGNLARIDLEEKRPDAARRRFERALAVEPNNTQVLLGLAALMRSTGAPPTEVLGVLERAVRDNPKAVEARVALVDALSRSGDPRRALLAAQEADAAIPNEPRILALLGGSQQAAGDLNQAIATFQRLAAASPQSVDPMVRLSGAYVAAKDYPAAVTAMRKALALQPGRADLHRELALLQVRAGRPDEALAAARALQRQQPKQASGYVIEGDVFGAQQKWADATNAYRAGLKLGRSPALAVRLHAALENDGQMKEAEQLAAGWLKEYPADLTVRLYLAERDLRAKRYVSAVEHYRAALRWAPNSAVVLNNLAWAASKLGDPQALSYAEKANALAPNDPAILDTLGWMIVEQGDDAARGVDLLQRAAALAPESAEIRIHLAKALLKTDRVDAARRELEILAKAPASTPFAEEAGALLKGLK